jgi:hypothetical protein
MTDILAGLTKVADLVDLGHDALLTVLAEIIDGIGTGTEWTGEQIDRLGELEGKLADKLRALRGG